jgi:hypothetical protein
VDSHARFGRISSLRNGAEGRTDPSNSLTYYVELSAHSSLAEIMDYFDERRAELGWDVLLSDNTESDDKNDLTA